MNHTPLRPLSGILLLALALVISTFSTASAQNRIIPEGGELFTIGKEYRVQWGIERFNGPVRLKLWDGQTDTWRVLAPYIPTGQGHFDWIVPSGLSGDMFRIRIESIASPNVYSFSGGYFSIIGSQSGAASVDRGSVSDVAGRTRLSPNPVKENAMFTWEQGALESVIVSDAAGRTVLSMSPTSRVQGAFNLSVADLTNGWYMVELHFASGRVDHHSMLVQR